VIDEQRDEELVRGWSRSKDEAGARASGGLPLGRAPSHLGYRRDHDDESSAAITCMPGRDPVGRRLAHAVEGAAVSIR
jgi:hypothetical protein